MVKPQPWFAVPSFGLALCLLGSCKSSVPQPPRVETAGTRIDVQKVVKEAKRMRLDVRVRIWNDHDQRISFSPSDVRLLWNGREVAAVPVNAAETRWDVQAKSGRDLRWYFELGEAAAEGTYPVEIRNVQRGDQPLGDTPKFAIRLGA